MKKQSEIITPWTKKAADRGRTIGKKRGGDFQRRYEKPKTPYAAGTYKILLDRYFTILSILENDITNTMGPIEVTLLGELIEMSGAAVRVTCNHLVLYLQKYGLDTEHMLISREIQGLGLTWQGGKDIACAVALIEQHQKKLP